MIEGNACLDQGLLDKYRAKLRSRIVIGQGSIRAQNSHIGQVFRVFVLIPVPLVKFDIFASYF